MELLKVTEKEVPFYYLSGYSYKYEIKDKIFLKDKERLCITESAFHPARTIGSLMPCLYNGREDLLDEYLPLLLNHAKETATEVLFPYDFTFAIHGDIKDHLNSGWVSGFCQGLAIAFFTKLYKDNLKIPYLTKLRNSFENEKIIERDSNGDIHFHEYEGKCKALNGHIFAIYGLYVYWYYANDEKAKELILKGISWVKNNFDKYRNPGKASFYCTTHKVVCNKVNGKYHAVHIKQMIFLYKITNDETFKNYAELLLSDFTDKNYKFNIASRHDISLLFGINY